MSSILDTSAAEFYDTAVVPEIFRPWAELMVNEARLEKGMRALDVACGTGVVARCVAAVCGAPSCSSGVDIDPAMIEVAKAAAKRHGLDIDYRCGSAGELPFEAAYFDAAFCHQGFQYFPDKSLALAELRRVLRRGAILSIGVWAEMQECAGNWAMIIALERRGLDASSMRKPFALADAVALRSLVEQAGFDDIRVEVARREVRFASAKAYIELVAQGAPSSRLALAQVPQSQWPDFVADVESQLEPWIHAGRLEFPMANNLLTARRGD